MGLCEAALACLAIATLAECITGALVLMEGRYGRAAAKGLAEALRRSLVLRAMSTKGALKVKVARVASKAVKTVLGSTKAIAAIWGRICDSGCGC